MLSLLLFTIFFNSLVQQSRTAQKQSTTKAANRQTISSADNPWKLIRFDESSWFITIFSAVFLSSTVLQALVGKVVMARRRRKLTRSRICMIIRRKTWRTCAICPLALHTQKNSVVSRVIYEAPGSHQKWEGLPKSCLSIMCEIASTLTELCP